MSKYLLPGEKLPEPPAANPVMSFPAITATAVAPLFDNLPAAISDATPHHFEHYDLGYGAMLYRTTLPAGPEGTLSAADVHDWGHVYLDGKPLGVMDRRSHHFNVQLPARTNPATIDILVETAGRVNFGAEVHDEKGLYTPVKFAPRGGSPTELTGNWQIYPLPLDGEPYKSLNFQQSTAATNSPACYRFTLNTDKPADTFLDMRSWGKGIAWVNGHCLGRFWSIGPTQTMYLPGPWLKSGANDIVLLDFDGPEKTEIAGLEKPILNELRPERDLSQEARPKVQLIVSGTTPAQTGTFPPGSALQEVKFAAPATGHYFCIESLNAQDGKPFTAIAELDLLDDGKPLSHEGWTIAYVDSEERSKEDGTAENAIDGQTSNFWHTQWGDAQPKQPHYLVLDLGKSQTISGFRYVHATRPRQHERPHQGLPHLCRGQFD